MVVRITLVLLITLPAVLALPAPWRKWETPKHQSLPWKWGEIEASKKSPIFLETHLQAGAERDRKMPKHAANIASVGTFAGCYSDAEAGVLSGANGLVLDDNINANCQLMCKKQGHAVASTKGSYCYCSASLPTPQLYRANDTLAAGNGGPCSTICPGVFERQSCHLDECCGGENAYSVYIVGEIAVQTEMQAEAEAQRRNKYVPKHFPVANIQATGTFDGCYSDAEAMVLNGTASALIFESDDNYNEDCQRKCQEQGRAIASTKGRYCYCTYSLPIPRLYRPDDTLSAGNGGPCSTVCPGVFASHSCRGDECCGGPNAYSVFIVGEIDVLRQLERRAIDRVRGSSRVRELIAGPQAFRYQDKWVRYLHSGNVNDCRYRAQSLITEGHIIKTTSYSTRTGAPNNDQLFTNVTLQQDCTFDRVKVTLDYYDRASNIAGPTFGLLNVNGSIWYSYTPAEDLTPVNSRGSQFVFDFQIPSDAGKAKTLLAYFQPDPSVPSGLHTYCNSGRMPAEVTMEAWGTCPLPVKEYEVSVVASGQTATSSGVQGNKIYNLTRLVRNGGENLQEVNPGQSPLEDSDMLDMEMVAMEKLIESEEPIQEEAFSDWDIVCDNIFGGAEISCSKDYTRSTTFRDSWKIENGLDLKVTVGASFTAGALFAKATTSFEVSVGYSFTFGYTRTQSFSRSESFSVSATVPAGAKTEVRFFSADVPVEVKWRATIFAEGFVIVRFVDKDTGIVYGPKKLHISQLLTYNERVLFAFGTLDFGRRPTLIARTRTVDRDGNMLSQSEDRQPVQPNLS